MSEPLPIRELAEDELHRIAGIDPREIGTLVYYFREARVVVEPEEWERPPWSREQARSHIDAAAEELSRGGTVYAAFDGERLVGFATFRPVLEPGSMAPVFLSPSMTLSRRGRVWPASTHRILIS